jgi:hypothetical protein
LHHNIRLILISATIQVVPLPWEDSGEVDRDEIRAWLRSMSDRDLKRTVRAAAFMVSPKAARNPLRPVFLVQLEEARAEWRRRHVKEP